MSELFARRIAGLLLACALILPSSALAYDGTPLGFVSSLVVGPTGNINVQFEPVSGVAPLLCGDTPAGAGMTTASVVIGFSSVNDSGARSMLSVLTSAFLARKHVRIYTTISGSTCLIGLVEITP